MRQRCDNPKSTKFENYGGRGIFYDPKWSSFSSFLADMGERPEGCSLDRVDTNGPYTKENCKWSTVSEQNRNTRTNKKITYKGVTLTNQEWSSKLGMPASTLYNRIYTRNWPVEKAFLTPVRSKRDQRIDEIVNARLPSLRDLGLFCLHAFE